MRIVTDFHKDSEHIIIEMFHKSTDDSSKQKILNNFTRPDGSLRCVVATVALGMGIDIPDVELIVHVGCPKIIISYWQETGRCARDGRREVSLILYDSFTASLKTTDKAMSELVKSSACYRKQVLKFFSVCDEDRLDSTSCKACHDAVCQCVSCLCCSLCTQSCKCPKKTDFDVKHFFFLCDRRISCV